MINQSFSSVLLFLWLAMGTLGVRATTVTVDIEAHIDGRDRLIIRDGTLQWEHFEFGAVGRAGTNSWPTIISTSIDGVPVLDHVEWFPEWSAPAPTPIRQPEFSNVFTGLAPSVAGLDHILVEGVQARSDIAIIEWPGPANQHTTVLEFNDNGPGGADWYKARVTFGSERLVPPQIVQWEIEGTIVDLGDSDMIFPDLQLGDPVRAVLRYDRSTPPSSTDPKFRSYDHGPEFELIRMSAENTRDQRTITFVPDPEPRENWSGVDVTNGSEDAPVEELDYIDIAQPVVPPSGFSGAAPVVWLLMEGPPDLFTDASLPERLELDDWEFPVISFLDPEKYFASLFTGEDPGSFIMAEIHTLRPIAAGIPGDFNGDSRVDAADYDVWKASFGSTTELAADGNSNGIVDAADFVVWRHGVAAGTAAEINAHRESSVPEPAGLPLVAAAMVLFSAHLPRRCCRNRTTPKLASQKNMS